MIERLLSSEWGLPAPLLIRPINRGRVNLTLKIQCNTGDYVFQRLHPIFGRDGAVVENVVRVTECLADQGLPTPRVTPTRDGRWWTEDEGYLWRLMTWLPGRSVGQPTVRNVIEAAGFLGRFHRLLNEDPPNLMLLPPAEHNRDGPSGLDAWQDLMDRYRLEPSFQAVAGLIQEGMDLVRELSGIVPATRACLHGDPKLDNFLFAENGRATALIDLDTVRSGYLIWELADALRSWSGRRGPDDPVRLDRTIYESAVTRYRESGLPLTGQEWARLHQATAAVALNLARRYWVDYFEQSYFAWDRERYPSLAEQNMRRGGGLLRLARDLLDQF